METKLTQNFTKGTEKWKSINGYEGVYEVSNFGRVKTLDKFIKGRNNSFSPRKSKIIKGEIDKDGYHVVTLTHNRLVKKYKVHRLVAIHFVPNVENKPQVNHIDNVKNNNVVANLEWVYPSENSLHMKKCNRQATGEKVGNSKLCAKKVLEIRGLCKGGVSYNHIASTYDVYVSTIYKINKRETWKHL